MPRKPKRRVKGVKKGKRDATRPAVAAPIAKKPVESDRVTYRELRNTPGRVWERLAENTPLTLVADGEVKAVVIPITDGDPARALSAYRRGRALQAMQEIREEARRNGTSKMTLAEINAIIREVRRERAAEAMLDDDA